jgi:hypothetical protein
MHRDLLAQPSGVDQLPHKAASGQSLHGPLHEWLTAHAQQGLGGLIGQWAHALAAPSGQHHGLGGMLRDALGVHGMGNGGWHPRMLPRLQALKGQSKPWRSP